MASLYLGTGPLEQELVDCLESSLEKSLQAKFPSNLKVSILLDFTRGSRGRKNFRTMLLPLLRRFPEHVHACVRACVRAGGRQTSEDSSDSLSLSASMRPSASSPARCTSLTTTYCRAVNKRVMDVIHSARTRQQMLRAQTFHSDSLLSQEEAAAAGDWRPAPDTWIYPLIQMKPFEIQIDEIVTETLLMEAERGAKVFLNTGYFSLTQAYMGLVLGSPAEYQIRLASLEVNGFFGAKGVAGAIPAAYVHIEFYSEVYSLGQ